MNLSFMNRSVHLALSIESLGDSSLESTVVNKLSNTTWNWGKMFPVNRFNTNGTVEACLGNRPKCKAIFVLGSNLGIL